MDHVKDLIELIDDQDDQQLRKSLYDRDIFPFTYNNIGDANLNPHYNPEKFSSGGPVVMEFTTSAINFYSEKNL